MSTKTAKSKLTYYVKSNTYSHEYIKGLFPSDKWIEVHDTDREEYKHKNKS